MDMNFLQRLGLLSGGGAANLAPDPTAAAPSVMGAAPPAPLDVNAFQAVNGGPQDAPQPVAAPPQAAPAAAPRPRRSILDTVGRLSDVLATVGGAKALYQPTLDGREDRALALGDHARQVDLDKLKLLQNQQQVDQGTNTLADQGSAHVGIAAKGTLAILKANPGADISRVWPLIAKQAGIPDDQAAQIGQQIAADPSLLNGFSDTFDKEKEKYSGQVIYGKDAQGNLKAYQASQGSGPAREVSMDPGFAPVDPFKTVNLGDRVALVGGNSGNTQTILPVGEKPGAAADRAQRGTIAADRNATTIQVAGMPARGKADGGSAGDMAAGSRGAIRVLRDLDTSISDLIGDKRIGEATGLVAGRMNVTSGQRAISGKIDSLEGQGIPAAIAAIKASGGASPRAVSEIMGEVKGLIGALRSRTQDTGDYVTNITNAQNRLRGRINALEADATRKAAAPKAAPKAATITPRTTKGGPSVTNW